MTQQPVTCAWCQRVTEARKALTVVLEMMAWDAEHMGELCSVTRRNYWQAIDAFEDAVRTKAFQIALSKPNAKEGSR